MINVEKKRYELGVIPHTFRSAAPVIATLITIKIIRQEDLLVKVGGKELTPGPFQMYSGDLFDPYLNVSIFSSNLFDHMLEKYGFPLMIIVAVPLILLLNCQPKRLAAVEQRSAIIFVSTYC